MDRSKSRTDKITWVDVVNIYYGIVDQLLRLFTRFIRVEERGDGWKFSVESNQLEKENRIPCNNRSIYK